MDFVKFRGDFQSKMPMIYGRKQSTLCELRHISTILARVLCVKQLPVTGLSEPQIQHTLREVHPFLQPPCDLIYHDSVFKRGAILVLLRACLTLPTRLHRIFESVPKRWISSSFVVIFDPKC